MESTVHLSWWCKQAEEGVDNSKIFVGNFGELAFVFLQLVPAHRVHYTLTQYVIKKNQDNTLTLNFSAIYYACLAWRHARAPPTTVFP